MVHGELVDKLICAFTSLTYVQSVIDGDLCEQYNSLDPAKKREIALDLDRTPNEVFVLFCSHVYVYVRVPLCFMYRGT